MQQNTPKHSPVERARRWLLARRHITADPCDAPALFALPPPLHRLSYAAGLMLLGWALSQGTLLFSVNPLAHALVCALPQGTPYALAGALLGIWQGGYDRPILLFSVLLAPAVRLALQLLSYGESAPDPHTRAKLRRTLWIYARTLLRRLGRAGADADENESSENENDREEAASAPAALCLSAPSPQTRVLASLITALFPALLLPLRGGFAFYDLYGALLILVLSPVATALFGFALAAPQRPVAPCKRTLGTLFLVCAVCFCLRSLRLLGIVPAVVFLTVVALTTVHKEGLLYALLRVLVGGLAISYRCLLPLSVATVVYALGRRALGQLALPLCLLCAVGCTLLTGGQALFFSLAPSVSVALLLFSVTRAMQQRQAREQRRREQDYHHDAAAGALRAEQLRSAALISRLSAIAGAFHGLSETFLRLGEHLQNPTAGELRRLCDGCFDRYCPTCTHKEHCWSQEYEHTLPAIDRLADALLRGERAQENLLSEGMRARCPHKSLLLGDINYAWAHRTLRQQQGALSEHFANDCALSAALLRDALSTDRLANDCESEPSAALGRALLREGAHFHCASVFGSERCTVLIEGCTKDGLGIDEARLHHVAQDICGCMLTPPHFEDEGEGAYRLESVAPLQAHGLYRSLPAGSPPDTTLTQPRHNEICGDSMRLFGGPDGAYYALLCDGMGNGQAAALTSGTSVVLLERLLRAGVGIDTAMGLLNHFLASRGDSPEQEISSTVDLLALDLYSGKARFVKSGAADTLILRQGQLYSVSCHTLPLGILQALDVQVVPFSLQDGDMVLMMSDGVTEISSGKTEQACQALYHLLCEAPPPQDEAACAALLDRILAQARALGAADDLTVAAIRIQRTRT